RVRAVWVTSSLHQFPERPDPTADARIEHGHHPGAELIGRHLTIERGPAADGSPLADSGADGRPARAGSLDRDFDHGDRPVRFRHPDQARVDRAGGAYVPDAEHVQYRPSNDRVDRAVTGCRSELEMLTVETRAATAGHQTVHPESDGAVRQRRLFEGIGGHLE